jgi:inner membrane protein
MNRKGHIGLVLLVSVPFALLLGLILNPPWTVIVVGTALLADRIPDKDHQIPFILHRGITHTVIFGAIASFVLAVSFTTIATITRPSSPFKMGLSESIATNPLLFAVSLLGFALGFTAHLLGDMLIKAYDYAVTPYWPFSRRPVALGWASAESKHLWDWGLLLFGILTSVGLVAGVFALN